MNTIIVEGGGVVVGRSPSYTPLKFGCRGEGGGGKSRMKNF